MCVVFNKKQLPHGWLHPIVKSDVLDITTKRLRRRGGAHIQHAVEIERCQQGETSTPSQAGLDARVNAIIVLEHNSTKLSFFKIINF